MTENELAYEIQVNDEDPVVTGAPELSVLSAMLTHVSDRGGCDLSVAGLVVHDENRHEHWRWLSRSLAVGDCVTIRVVDPDSCAPPLARETIDPTQPRKPD